MEAAPPRSLQSSSCASEFPDAHAKVTTELAAGEEHGVVLFGWENCPCTWYATLTVNFDVAVADSAVASRVDSLTSGDASVVESMTSAVESGLAAQNIQVTIVSVDAQQFQDAEIPSTSQRANDPLAPTVPPDAVDQTMSEVAPLVVMAIAPLLEW